MAGTWGVRKPYREQSRRDEGTVPKCSEGHIKRRFKRNMDMGLGNAGPSAH